jgi:DNA-binding MarR family transcriptional regulator
VRGVRSDAGAAPLSDAFVNMSGAVTVQAKSSSSEPRISYAVARLERAVRGAVAERVRPYGLTTLQYTTLSVLNRHGEPLSNAQLARRAYMTPQAMSKVIDALEANGLIRRNAHPKHGRLLPVSLTAKGRRVLAECERRVDEMEDVMLAGLSARERTAFREMLKSSVRALGAGFPHD